jgi:hypothetical protein
MVAMMSRTRVKTAAGSSQRRSGKERHPRKS